MLTLALLAAWLAPVDGSVDRSFAGGPDPFAAGLRRALILRAEAGEGVRAPCSGRVSFAGSTPRGPALTLRCGARKATLMGLRPAAHAGDRVRRGARVGTASGSVRLSVREATAYVDPAPLLRRPARPPGVAPPRLTMPRAVRPSPPTALPPPRTVPAPRTPALPVGAPPPAAPAPVATAPRDTPAPPWPTWAGAALLAVAAASGVRVRARRRPRAAVRAA